SLKSQNAENAIVELLQSTIRNPQSAIERSWPVSRRYASRYFSLVILVTSGGAGAREVVCPNRVSQGNRAQIAYRKTAAVFQGRRRLAARIWMNQGSILHPRGSIVHLSIRTQTWCRKR